MDTNDPVAAAAPVLRADNLRKRYGGREVVQGVSLSVNAGEVVGLLGPNGAGKSTCFRMLTGLVRADEGHVWLGAQSLDGLPFHRRAAAGIGYLPQEPSVFGALTVLDNVLSALEAVGIARSERRQRAHALLDEYGLGALATHRARTLSGGERRRLEIARVLARRPGVILLDEPFTGVDPLAIDELQALLTRLAKDGIGVLFTDHNVHDSLRLASRVLILSAGLVVAEGPPAAILAHDAARRLYLGERFSAATPNATSPQAPLAPRQG